MGHSIINDARNAAGVVPKVYFSTSGKPLMELPICNMKPIDLATTVLSDSDHGSKRQNPFKSKNTFSIAIIPPVYNFKGCVPREVVDLCNQVLPFNAQGRCVRFILPDRLFNKRLWMSRYLANLESNKNWYEDDIKRMARVKVH